MDGLEDGVGTVAAPGGGTQTPAVPATNSSSLHGQVPGGRDPGGGTGVVTTVFGTQYTLGFLDCLDVIARAVCPLGHVMGSDFAQSVSRRPYPSGHARWPGVVLVGTVSVGLKHWGVSPNETARFTRSAGHASEYIVLTQHLRRARHSGNTTGDPRHRCVASPR